MRNLAQEISEDYVLGEEEEQIANDAAIDGAFGDDIDTLNSDLKEIEAIEQEIAQLHGASLAIENFGINQTAIQIMTLTGLMSGTALESMALESIGEEHRTSVNSVMAIEALTDKIKEKASAWAAKILSALSKGANFITGTLTGLWDKITESAKTLTSKAWDATKVAGATIKAHPYKTILAVLAAAAAAAAVVAFVGTGLPAFGCTNGAMAAFMTKINTLYRAIKFPGTKIVTSIADNGVVALAKLEVTAKVVAQSAKTATLGWTTNSVKAIATHGNRVWGIVKGAITPVWERAIKPINKVIETGQLVNDVVSTKVETFTGSKGTAWMAGKIAGGYYFKIVNQLVSSVFQIVKSVIIRAFQMVRDTFKSLTAVTE